MKSIFVPLAPDGEGGRFTRLPARHHQSFPLGADGQSLVVPLCPCGPQQATAPSMCMGCLLPRIYYAHMYVHTYIHCFIVATELAPGLKTYRDKIPRGCRTGTGFSARGLGSAGQVQDKCLSHVARRLCLCTLLRTAVDSDAG